MDAWPEVAIKVCFLIYSFGLGFYPESESKLNLLSLIRWGVGGAGAYPGNTGLPFREKKTEETHTGTRTRCET